MGKSKRKPRARRSAPRSQLSTGTPGSFAEFLGLSPSEVTLRALSSISAARSRRGTSKGSSANNSRGSGSSGYSLSDVAGPLPRGPYNAPLPAPPTAPAPAPRAPAPQPPPNAPYNPGPGSPVPKQGPYGPYHDSPEYP